jgi:hypothetical protein
MPDSLTSVVLSKALPRQLAVVSAQLPAVPEMLSTRSLMPQLLALQ